MDGLRLVQEDAATELAWLGCVALVGGDDSIERSPRAADLAHEGLLEHGRLPTCTRIDPRSAAVRLAQRQRAYVQGCGAGEVVGRHALLAGDVRAAHLLRCREVLRPHVNAATVTVKRENQPTVRDRSNVSQQRCDDEGEPATLPRRCGVTAASQRHGVEPHALPGRPQDLVRQLPHSHNLHGDHQGRVADADRRRTPRKGPPLPHARRRPSRARLSERRPRTHVPLTS